MAKLFISYAHENKEWVHKLEKDLKDVGHQPLVDERSIHGGEGLSAAISQLIANSDFVLPVLSQAWGESKWVQIEFREAIEKGVRLLPILYRPFALPPFVSVTKYVDFTNEENYAVSFANLLLSLPNPHFDELQSLRELLAEAKRKARRSLPEILPLLMRAASRRESWKRATPNDLMEELRQTPGTTRFLNDLYWWCIIVGILTFEGIESEEMAHAEEYWEDSIRCAMMTPRGRALLDDLSLESRTRKEIMSNL